MRWTRWVAVLMSAAALAAVASVLSCTSAPPAATPAAMTEEQKIALGRELAWSSGCMDCHTPGSFYGAPDTTRMLSGSDLGWQGPWGVSYPRNLTPDMETGIGSWTEEQIITAFTQGHRPNGTPLLPPMPWPSFAHMPRANAEAIAAYLKSIPPISHQVPAVIPPGQPVTGAALVFPPPPAWDAQNLPPPPASGGATTP